MKISGTGSVLPKKVVTNEMLSRFLDTSDEWITTRTGVRTRHVISDEKLCEDVTDMHLFSTCVPDGSVLLKFATDESYIHISKKDYVLNT